MPYGGFQLVAEGSCILCRSSLAVPVLVAAATDVSRNLNLFGVCEPCARLADWRFRVADDSELAGVPFPTVPGAALVLIVRDRVVDGHPDTLSPYDVLMVGRKDEPGKWGLPGGKVESGEAPVAAAVRELAEETKVLTWTTGLNLLYSGFSLRGRLVDTYLCRAYSVVGTGDMFLNPEGLGVEWKAWPPSQHVGVFKGYYRGLELAFEARLKLRREIGNEPPLCQRLGKSALQRITEGFSGEGRDVHFMQAMAYVMTEEEKQASKIVLAEILESMRPPEAKQADESEAGGQEKDAAGDELTFNDDEREGPGSSGGREQ